MKQAVGWRLVCRWRMRTWGWAEGPSWSHSRSSESPTSDTWAGVCLQRHLTSSWGRALELWTSTLSSPGMERAFRGGVEPGEDPGWERKQGDPQSQRWVGGLLEVHHSICQSSPPAPFNSTCFDILSVCAQLLQRESPFPRQLKEEAAEWDEL